MSITHCVFYFNNDPMLILSILKQLITKDIRIQLDLDIANVIYL